MKIIYQKSRHIPSEGDVKVLKSGARFVRQICWVHDNQGKRLGMQVAHGRPVFEWVPTSTAKDVR